MVKILRLVTLAAVVAVWTNYQKPVFVPPPVHGSVRHAVPAAAAVGAATMFGTSPASATYVDDAARKLATVAYPLIEQVNWASVDPVYDYIKKTKPTKEAMQSMLQLGLSMNPALVNNAVWAHKKAIDAVGDNLITPYAQFEDVVVAVSNMLASAPAEKILAIYEAVPKLDDLNGAWYKQVSPATANEAYDAFMELSNAVRR